MGAPRDRWRPTRLPFERFHVDHKAVFHVSLQEALVRFVDLLYADGLDLTDDPVLGTELEQFLGFSDAADSGPGKPAPSQQQTPETSSQAGGPPGPNSTAESIGDLLRTFAGPAIDPSQPTVDGGDIKVLMTRCGQMAWPDGESFNSKDGKAMIQALFKVESTKELRKPQVDWLYEQFGRVLSKQAHLVRDEKGIPFIKEGQPAAAAQSA